MPSRLDIWIKVHKDTYTQDLGCNTAIVTADAARSYEGADILTEPFCRYRDCEGCVLSADTNLPNNMNKVLRTLVIE